MEVHGAENSPRRRLWFWAAVVAMTALTAVMRFYRLTDIPFGLHLDEAYNGLDAYSLLGKPLWDWPLFFPRNFGREPLHIYLEALVQAVFGPTKLAVRFLPAAVSVAVTPALVWLGWEWAPHLGVRKRRHFALMTGLAVLTLLWSQMHARILVRGGLFLLLEVLILASFWRAWNVEKPVRWWALAGFLAGVSFYTYLPARLLPLYFLLVVPVLLWRNPGLRALDQVRVHWRGATLAVVVGLATAAPLLVYFFYHPEDFLLRSSQVVIFADRVNETFSEQVLGILGMAFVRGDFNVRMNYPLRPVLDLFMVGPFLLGLARLVQGARRPGPYGALALAAVMLLPTLLSEDAPNFGRAIGALPVFTLAIALGLEQLLIWSQARGPLFARGGAALGYGLLLASVVVTWRAYFVAYARLPEVFHVWDEGMTRMAYDAASTDPGARVYFAPQGFEHPTTQFLLLEQPPHRINGFDSRICVRVATDAPAFYYFVFDDFYRGPVLLQNYLPDSSMHTAVVDTQGNVWAKRLDQPAGGRVQFPEQVSFPVALSDGISLQGYWLSEPEPRPGDRLYVRLFWRVDAAPTQDYTAFAHLVSVDSTGASTQLAGADSRPGGGSCPTNLWLPGEVVVDELQFVTPAETTDPEDADLYIEVGFYTLADGRRLDIPDNAEDRILIGPLQLATP